MRLGQFRLECYGPFERCDLPFDPTPGRVNLIVAPNGYGKSVIRRGIHEFLFRIDPGTAMTFRFGTERMRLSADVIQDGTTQSLVRRKGNGNTLALTGGGAFTPDETRRLLGGADVKIFQELFGLDTTLLRSGGQDLIHSQGRLGQVLFAAGGGMVRVHDLLADLVRKRDDLGRATTRHRNKPIWSALSAWEEGDKALRTHALRPDNWATLQHQTEHAAANLQTLLTEQASEAGERDRLHTLAACRPWLDRLCVARQTLIEVSDAPGLDASFENCWRNALTDRATAASSVSDATTELQSARDARDALTFNPAWLAAESSIKALADLRGEVLSAERDLPSVARDLAAGQAKAMTLRRDLGWPESFPLPIAPVVKDARHRLQQHPKLALDAVNARDALEEANCQRAATEADLANLPPDRDLAALIDLAALLRAGGDPDARLDTARRKLRGTEAALRTALIAIPDCALGEATLAATAAPSEGRLEAAGKALAEADFAHAAAVRDHAAQRRAIQDERAKLAGLERTASLPPPDALANARADRDDLWTRLQTQQPWGLSDTVALDRAVRQADAVADALIAHGQEVAEATAIRASLTTREAELAGQAKAATQAAAAAAEARDELLLMARTAGGNAADMAALRAFLGARDAAIRCRDARDAATADLADIQCALTTIGHRLAEAMAVEMPDLAILGTLLAEADRRIEAGRLLMARRRALTDQTTRQRTVQAAAAAAKAKAEKALADWQTGWQPISVSLARPDTAEPDATADALARIEDLRATEQKAADDQRRVKDMQDAIALLAKKVAALASLSPEFAVLPPTEAADAFQRRLQGEYIAAANCAGADRRIEQASQRLAQATAAAEAASRTLTGLRAALRADTDDEAEHQLRRAHAAAAAGATEAEALRELAVQGRGLGIDLLTTRAAETTADADTARIAEIDTGQQARVARIDAARIAKDAATTAQEQAGSGLDAAEAAQRREAAQALLARTAEEALILHATHALLHAALDRQAAGADQPLLARIGEVFRTITGGAHAGVRVEETRDGQTMVALEADGTTRKSLDQLSEGTCDQLYLALRVAALEDYAAATSPLPFIADDILQTFDDPRTAATMQALLQLSQRVQVIVLTHHTHVGDLAARLPGGAVRVMRLPE